MTEETNIIDDGPQKPRYQVTFRHDQTDLSDVHRYPRVLDFSTFTTQGMRRTVREGESRFVTPSKLLALITAVSEGLSAFGASSTMDSALSPEVLETLLFQDGTMIQSAHQNLRGVSMERSQDRKDRTKRKLEALDLCHCTSRFFEAALTKFVEKHLRKFSGRATSTVHEEGDDDEEEEGESANDEEREERGRRRSRGRDSNRTSSQPMTMSRSKSTHRMDFSGPSKHPARATLFPSVLRLGLNGVHFPSELLSPFVLAFSRLTHLDLSGTRADESLLQALSASPDLELESLSLARCARITSASLTELLVDSPVCANLIELSLEGTVLYPTPLTKADLATIITTAPFIRSGSLRYLDLGGCGLNDALLASIPQQPALIDLGLSASPLLSLTAIAQFLLKKAPNVQVLGLVESCDSMGPLSVLQLNVQLLDPCTTTPPLSISEQIAAMGLNRPKDDQTASPLKLPTAAQAKTNLRILGLSMPLLRQIQGALGNWSVILGKGRRGWLVDVSSGPNPEAVDEDLEGSDSEDQLPSPLNIAMRVRQVRHVARGSWEPETPPRRLSRSPSTSKTRSNVLMARQGSSSVSPAHSQSRSRSRHMPLSPLSGSKRDKDQEEEEEIKPRAEVIRNLARHHPRRLELERLSRANGHVSGTTGWHSKKMEVLLGMGMLGREGGSYAYAAYQQ